MANNLSRATTVGRRLTKCYPDFQRIFGRQISVPLYSKFYSSTNLNSFPSANYGRIVQRSFSQGSFSMFDQSEKVESALHKTLNLLTEMSVPEPENSSKYLISHALGYKHKDACDDLLDKELTPEQITELGRLVACRMARMPVQYIVGDWDFREITLQVRPPVFIPRPETEQLVEIVLNHLPADKPVQLLEVGPGCGTICLSLLHENKNIKKITALERSKMATDLTKENAKLLDLSDRLEVHEVKVEGATELPQTVKQQKYDAIVSNPPYVLRKDLANLEPEISLYEDLRALDGGAQGLDVILDILKLANQLLVQDGQVYLEVDPCHPLLLPDQLIKQSLPFKVLETIKDFRGKNRFMVLGRE